MRSFSYTPRAGFSEEFLLHSSSWFYWGVSVSYVRDTSGFIEELLLHSSSWFYWGVSLTLFELVFVTSFSYTPGAGFRDEFLLHSSIWFSRGVSVSYIRDTRGFSEEFLLHSSNWFYWGVSLTLLELVLVMSFSYTPQSDFSEEFQSLTFLMLGVLVRSFSDTP